MLSGFRFALAIPVRFRDLDAMGHVNNAVFLTYLESARIAYWLQVQGRTGLSGMDMILARVEIDYRSPLGWGETVDVGVRVVSLRRSSFVMEFRVEETGSGRLVAEGRKVLVYYDYAAGKSAPLPPELRERIRRQDPDVVEEA